MCKGMVDPGFSSDPKNTKATKTRKTAEPIFQGGGGRKGHGEVLAGWKTRRQSRVRLGARTVKRSSRGFLIEWSWQAGGASLGLLSAESAERPITDTTKLHKCHFPSRGRPSLLPCITLRAPPEERFIFLNNPSSPR